MTTLPTNIVAGDPGHVDHHNAVHAVTNRVTLGNGDPEGVVTAPVGHLFIRGDGGANTVLYVKESGAGNTGWVAK